MKPWSGKKEAHLRANSLVRGCVSAMKLHGLLAVRFNNQPIAQKVDGQLVGYRRLLGPRGIPDIWAVAPGGRLLVSECKSGSGRLSIYQVEFMDKLDRVGALVMVARSVVDVIQVCERGKRDGWSHTESPWKMQRLEER